MKRMVWICFFLCFRLAMSASTYAQFTQVELNQREEIENLLKTAEIISFNEIGEGVTKPYRIFLKAGEIEISGAWKNPSGTQQGFLEGWQYEIAAYEMDKLLGLDMVPPTVERQFRGRVGSLQYWVTSEMSDLDRMEEEIGIPKSVITEWENRKYLTRAFDCIIANDDRTQQNIRYTKDWRTILIDHSRSFRSTREHTRGLMFGKNGIKAVALFRRLPREFVEKVKALTFEHIKEVTDPYLTDREIKAIISRRDIFIKEVEEMVKENGEENVLY